MSYELSTEEIVYAAFLTTLIVVILCGNILICIAFIWHQRLRTVTNLFVISLAASDIFVSIIPMPTWLYFTIGKEWPTWFSPNWFVFIDVLTCVSSIGNLTAISIDRYFGVVMPLKRNIYMTQTRAMLVIVVVWVCSAGIASANQVLSLKDYTYFITVVGIFLPLLVIIYAYINIFATVRNRRMQISTATNRVGNNLDKEWKLARMILIVIFVFIICWSPFLALNLYYEISANWPPFTLINAIKWLHYFNSCCNPFIYGIFHTQFRRVFRQILCRQSRQVSVVT